MWHCVLGRLIAFFAVLHVGQVQASQCDTLVGFDFAHRGSELNDGRLTITHSDEECCIFCQNLTGELKLKQ